MSKPTDFSVLSRALHEGMISSQQYDRLMRQLEDSPNLTAGALLADEGGLSVDQLDSLLGNTSRGHDARTEDAAPSEPAAPAAPPDRSPRGAAPPAADSARVHENETLTMDEAAAAGHPPGKRPQGDRPTGEDETVDTGASAGSPFSDKASPARHQKLGADVNYQVHEEIARGGLGRVLRAHDQYIGRDVAIKEMLLRRGNNLERVERFLLEAQITGQLEHPGIVPIHALGISPGGQPFYAMKLIGGRTLSELIKEYHQLPASDPDKTVKLHQCLLALAQVCNAVAFAHSRGVLHRDLKPLNIMIGDFGETLVVDWGLAKMLRPFESEEGPSTETINKSTLEWSEAARVAAREADDVDGEVSERGFTKPSLDTVVRAVLEGTGGRPSREMTTQGTVIGTMPYMSPEQARGAVETLDQRSDIFSLGATLYEILVGHAPYQGPRRELLEKARLGRFPPPRRENPAVPRALEAICLKAMAIEPADRYALATQLADDLTRWTAGEPVSAYREPWYDRAGRWIRKHRTLCISTTAALIVLVAAATIGSIRRAHEVNRIAEEANTTLLAGIDASNDGRLEDAAAELRAAQGKISIVPSQQQLAEQIDEWIAKNQQRIDHRDARQSADEKLRRFRELYHEALYRGMLLAGYEKEQNVRRAEEAARQALGLFGVDPATSGLPQFGEMPLDEETRNELAEDCRDLRMVVADAEAEPLDSQSEEENRAGAQRALALLDAMPPGDHSMKAFYLRKAAYLNRAGETAEATAEFKSAEAITPVSAADHFLTGDFRYDQQDYTPALTEFQEALSEEPDHFWSQYYMGVCQIRLNRWREAVVSLTAAASRRPDFVYIYLLRGLALAELGQWSEADADFRHAAAIDQDEYGVYNNRGITRLRHGQMLTGPDEQEERTSLWKLAAADFEKAMSLKPDVPDAYTNRAELYRLEGDSGKAREILNVAISKAPRSAVAYKLRAMTYLDQKDTKAASADLDEAIRLTEQGSMLQAALYTLQGRIYHQAHDFGDALTSYELAIKYRPDYHEAFLMKALALEDLERYDEAVEWFTRYLDESPILSFVYRQGYAPGDGPEIAVGTSLPDKDPLPLPAQPRRLLAAVYRERGLARMALGRRSQALEDFARASELVPDIKELSLPGDRNRYQAMQLRQGWSFLLAGTQLALEAFNQVLAEEPGNAEALTGRGAAYVELGDWKKARVDAQRAVALGAGDSENPGMYFNAAGVLAGCYRLVGEDDSLADREKTQQELADAALAALRKCFDVSVLKRDFYLTAAREDAALAPLRKLEAFDKLLAEYSGPGS